jgi:MinD superfamily P-loop ATPase
MPSLKIAIASGKGGTGKTTVAVNLALASAEPIQLLDCDVEAPNVHLFLAGRPEPDIEVTRLVPMVDESRCDGCGQCSRFCKYHAVIVPKQIPMIFPELCHSCGGCSLICPQHAIHDEPQRIGVIRKRQHGNISLVSGHLDIGISMVPPLIRRVKAQQTRDLNAILDAPPGTSCPVITTVSGTDVVILVTEPTPFGLHDLTLAVEMVKALGVPFGIVVNRMGIGDRRVHDFCKAHDIPVLLDIPDDRRIAELYAKGVPVVQALPEYRQTFAELAKAVRDLSRGREKAHTTNRRYNHD